MITRTIKIKNLVQAGVVLKLASFDADTLLEELAVQRSAKATEFRDSHQTIQ